MSFWGTWAKDMVHAIGNRSEQRASIENPATPISNPDHWLVDLFGGRSASGISVNSESAMQSTPVWAAVNVLSNAFASLPLILYDDGDDGKKAAKDDLLYRLLHDAPNDELTSFRWRRGVMRDLLLKGRHYSRIELNTAGRIVGFVPLKSSNVSVNRRDGKLRYVVRLKSGGQEVLGSDEVLHFTGLDDADMIDGMNPILKLTNAIGLSLALEQFGSRFFSNGARPGLILEYPARLSPEGITQLKASIEASQGGVEKSHKIMVMEDGGKLHQISFNPEQSQFIEARKYQLEEIARGFNVPLSFLQNLDNAHFKNSEQQDLNFVKHTLRPWLVMAEQEMMLKLLPPTKRNNRAIEFNVDGMQRGDFKTRIDGVVRAIQGGLLTPNEGRALENRPALPGGDKLVLQQNMIPLADMTGDGNDGEDSDGETDQNN